MESPIISAAVETAALSEACFAFMSWITGQVIARPRDRTWGELNAELHAND